MGEDLMRSYMKGQGQRRGREDVESNVMRTLGRLVEERMPSMEREAAEGESSTQMRLLAEQLCRRAESKYERVWAERMERERNDTERRLAQLHRAFQRDTDAANIQLDRDRTRMQERLLEQEKEMHRAMQLKLSEREEKLEMERRRVEIRVEEMQMRAQELERARAVLREEGETEAERLRLERDRLAEWESNLARHKRERSTVVKAEQAGERERDIHKLLSTERALGEMKQRLLQAEATNHELKARLEQLSPIQAELSIAKDNYRRQLEESRRLSEEVRSRDDYEEMKREKERMEGEVDRMKREAGRVKEEEKKKAQLNYQIEEERARLKIRELKIVLSLLSDKLRGVTSERDYLRTELRAVRREKSTSTVRERAATAAPKMYERESSDSSISITSHSAFDMREIREKIKNMDEMSRRVDESMRHALEVMPADLSRYAKAEEEEAAHHSSLPLERSIGRERKKSAETASRRRKSSVAEVERLEEREKEEEKRTPPSISPLPVKEEVEKERGRAMPPGVDPVMAQYMRLLSGQRQHVKQATPPEEVEEEWRSDPIEAVDNGDDAFEW